MKTPFSRVLLIYNPNSTGNAPALADELREELNAKLPKLMVEKMPTKRVGHAVELAYEAAKKYKNPLLISVSGDGGYHEVINGALQAQKEGAKPICIVAPAGNANDHSRVIQERELSDAVINGEIEQMDVLQLVVKRSGKELKELYAHSYIGVGITPTVAVELNNYSLSRFKEMWLVLRTFWRYKPFEIEVDGQRRQLNSIIFANINKMAKVVKLNKHGNPYDGKLEVIEIPHWSKWALIRTSLRAIILGLPKAPQVKTFRFTALKPQPIQLDGEVWKLESNDEVCVTVKRGALRTLL